jgi:hypothetical protein
MRETTTTDIAKFGYTERVKLVELLTAWNDNGLPEDFYNDEVVPMMNFNSGHVFLTNSEYQVAMINPETDMLESFYYTPYSGHEGFANELKELFESDGDSWNQEDIDYLIELGIIEAIEESEEN